MSDPCFLSDSLTIQPPLSRCARGPGLILVRPFCYVICQQNNKTLDPEPLKKWAEESFTVAQITLDQSIESPLQGLIDQAMRELTKQGCDGEKIGLIGKGVCWLVLHGVIVSSFKQCMDPNPIMLQDSKSIYGRRQGE